MMMRQFLVFIFTLFLFVLISCKSEEKRLPYLGNADVVNGDTVYHHVPDIQLIDQDSNLIRISGQPQKVFIGDFFFTSCPSICPKVAKQMLRIYDRYKDDDRVLLLSHTIDTRHDSVSVLNRYAKNLGVDTDRWKFVTGQKDSIFFLADQYFVSALEDPSAPGGFDHSGRIILLDKNRRVRGFAEGTDPESVTSFFDVIDKLLNED
jgi:protein SCO1